ncbi:hypothetical protein Pla110_44410 [Polystyrenella longa]|uniref:Uncharacterized protein n=2 Tax=Polystyrenella longa TaxID=2528007 RepID=A0A518CTX0_9PLAN|nr:hypothetical protein Pla110_44410 [Polystyrenella longa]
MYYFPGLSRDQLQSAPELMQERGVDRALRDLYADWKPTHNVILIEPPKGPDGGRGTWVYALPPSGDVPRSTGYNADTQQWVDCGGYWLGIDVELRPTPEELQKPDVIHGYRYVLGDGLEWECPVVRERLLHHHLPSSYGYDHQAKDWVQQIDSDYLGLWERTAGWVDLLFNGDDYSDVQLMEDCCDLLSLNYRVHRDEITLLGLLTSKTSSDIFQAAVDGPWWKACLEDPQKKSELVALFAGVSSFNGDEGNMTDTTPVGPITSSSD